MNLQLSGGSALVTDLAFVSGLVLIAGGLLILVGLSRVGLNPLQLT